MQVFDYRKSKINVLFKNCRKLGADMSMPLPDSSMQFNVGEVKPNGSYKVIITAVSASGSNSILCNFFGGPRYDFQHHKIALDSREPKEYSVNMNVGEFPARTPISFRIWKYPGSQGSLIIKNVTIHKLPARISDGGAPRFSIVIPIFNKREVTERCIKSICDKTYTPHEIIIVDNGSTDGSAEYLQERFEGLRIIKNKENMGFAKACNQGILQARGRYVLLLNNDTKVVEEDWEASMLGTLDGGFADLTGPVGGLLDLNNFRFVKEIKDPNEEFHYLAGWCLMFKRELVDNIGLIPEEFGIGLYEDTAFCVKAAVKGFKLVITKNVPVFHYGHTTIKEHGFKELYNRNRERFSEGYGAMLRAHANKGKKELFGNFAAKNNNSSEIIPGKVSIVTLNYNGIRIMKKTIPTLFKNTVYPLYEWIISDNGSTDGSMTYLKEMEKKCSALSFYNRKTNSGNFASINNEVAKFANGEFLLFLNNDVEPKKFWMTEMVRIMRSDPSVSIVGSKLFYPNKKLQHAGVMFDPLGLPGNISYLNLAMFPNRSAFTEVDREFNAVTGACLMMRHEDFIKVGGFYEKYDYAYEDVDLCLAARKKLGKKVIFAASSQGIHYESFTTNKTKKKINLDFNTRILRKRWTQTQLPKDMLEYKRSPKRGVYIKARISRDQLFKELGLNVVVCVDDLDIYKKYLKKSIKEFVFPIKVVCIDNTSGKYTSMAKALNDHIKDLPYDISIIAHQDMELTKGFDIALINKIREMGTKWGVLGLAGVTNKDIPMGNLRAFDNKKWNSQAFSEGGVHIVDECCMILSGDKKLQFDESTFNSFHFYGADICLQAIDKSLKNYVIDIPAIHHSDEGKRSLNKTSKKIYQEEMLKLKRKWIDKVNVIRTTTCKLTKEKNIVYVKE